MTTAQRKALEDIIKQHAKKYPLMQPTDAVKLIYQNEFGGGHLIKDKEKCKAFLLEEYAAVEQKSQGEIFEPIGNSTVRVHLNLLDRQNLQPETLCEWFILSSERCSGSAESFEEKLGVLKDICAERAFSFSCEELQEYIGKCKEKGYPAVSHSEQYRRAYSPAYRIVYEEFIK